MAHRKRAYHYCIINNTIMFPLVGDRNWCRNCRCCPYPGPSPLHASIFFILRSLGRLSPSNSVGTSPRFSISPGREGGHSAKRVTPPIAPFTLQPCPSTSSSRGGGGGSEASSSWQGSLTTSARQLFREGNSGGKLSVGSGGSVGKSPSGVLHPSVSRRKWSTC